MEKEGGTIMNLGTAEKVAELTGKYQPQEI